MRLTLYYIRRLMLVLAGLASYAVCFAAADDLTAMAYGLVGPVKSVKALLPGFGSEYSEFDRQGRLIKKISMDGQIAYYSWNDNGELTVQTQNSKGESAGPKITCHWEQADNMMAIIVADSEWIAYEDDGKDRIRRKVLYSDGKMSVHNHEFDEENHKVTITVVNPDLKEGGYTIQLSLENLDRHGNAAIQKGIRDIDNMEWTTRYRYEYYED